MKHHFSLLVFIFFVLANTQNLFASASIGGIQPLSTSIDFHDKPAGTQILPNDYISSGVTINDLEGFPFFRFSDTIGTGSNAERGTDAYSSGWDGTIEFSFGNLLSDVEIFFGGLDGSGTLTIFDSAHNQLEDPIVLTGVSAYVWFTRPVEEIKYFQISGDNFALNDLQFSPLSPVPEPGTYGMMLVGLLLIGHTFRRRKNVLRTI